MTGRRALMTPIVASLTWLLLGAYIELSPYSGFKLSKSRSTYAINWGMAAFTSFGEALKYASSIVRPNWEFTLEKLDVISYPSRRLVRVSEVVTEVPQTDCR